MCKRAIAADVQTASLINDALQRTDRAIARLLARALDAGFDDIATVTFAVRSLLVSTASRLENAASRRRQRYRAQRFRRYVGRSW